MEYNVKIVRSSRKSLSLSVSPENEIIVRCPRGLSDGKINSFIASKKNWLDNAVAKNEVKLSANKGVLEYKEIYVGGNKFPLIIAGKNEITEGAVYVRNLKQIKSVFISRFSNEFISYAQQLSRTVNLRANGFSVRAYKRRWGCCDSRGVIRFNYLLFMLPPRVQRYVIIHELCHTVHFNHSADFWRLVANYEPDYRNLKARLKDFDYITNLY